MATVRVVSLLPSATEIVFAIGAEDVLCGVSCDCDYPAGVTTKPVVSATTLPITETSSPGAIDAMVREQLAESDSIYTLDRSLIRSLQPDVILAQDLCRVCAVPSGDVEEALDVIGCRADVLSLDPNSLTDVLHNIVHVGVAVGREERAREVVDSLRARLDGVRRATEAASPRPRVVTIEWHDPLFNGGHWIPEMVAIAGGDDMLGAPGARSRTVEWTEVVAADPDVIVFMPCGYDLEGAIAQVPLLLESEGFRGTRAAHSGDVFVADSSAYFSRSGPRLVDGVEILAGILHPDLVVPPDATRARRVGAR
ncbi:MAG: cobalamin-binding protein [Actinomycetota bacterium]